MSLLFLKQKRTSLDREDSLNPAGVQNCRNCDVRQHKLGGVLDVM